MNEADFLINQVASFFYRYPFTRQELAYLIFYRDITRTRCKVRFFLEKSALIGIELVR